MLRGRYRTLWTALSSDDVLVCVDLERAVLFADYLDVVVSAIVNSVFVAVMMDRERFRNIFFMRGFASPCQCFVDTSWASSTSQMGVFSLFEFAMFSANDFDFITNSTGWIFISVAVKFVSFL